MNEIRNIINKYDELKTQDISCVLATVVHVDGSSYRRSGARLLVDEWGNMTGSISGGCLEGDALKKALLSLMQNKIKLVEYDTSDESDAVIGAQLGCNGIIQVLFEPINYQNGNNAIELLRFIEETKKGGFIVINYSKTNECLGSLIALNDVNQKGEFEPSLLTDISVKLKDSKSGPHSFYFNNHKIIDTHFINWIKPPLNILIIGAGNDAIILSNMAQLLGWEVSVFDGRHTHATTDRFGANCQVFLGKAEDVLEKIYNPAFTAILLMSHNFQYDLKVLAQILKINQIPYIGILGPKKKFEKLQEALLDQNIQISKNQQKKIFAPVGFDIGAETPSEIALAILSEIQAVMSSKNGHSLKYKTKRIHI